MNSEACAVGGGLLDLLERLLRLLRDKEFRQPNLRCEVFPNPTLSLEIMRKVGCNLKITSQRHGELQMTLCEVIHTQGSRPAEYRLQ
jgi:hypothetical protein